MTIRHTLAWAAFAALNAPLVLVIGRIVFGGWGGFWNVTSDRWNAGVESQWAKYKLLIFILWSAAMLASTYYILARFGFGP